MKIYTKTGDTGETSLFGQGRIPKDSNRIDACGTVDELNSAIGSCRSLTIPRAIDRILAQIQEDLFVLGADIATPADSTALSLRRIAPSCTLRLEHQIDDLVKKLPPLKTFILPGGTPQAAAVHVARAVCRRAERRCVRLAREEPINPEIIVYLNRLSDLLFVTARRLNRISKKKEIPWKG